LKNKILHIVAFDVPYPPDYGGVVEVFYKIKALYENGVKIFLHCFEYGRGKPKALEQYCSEVYYYSRKGSFQSFLTMQPYIVASRMNLKLLKNLKAVKAPVLFEGQHTAGFLNHPGLADRKKYLRQHNVEWKYYERLAENESKSWKKTFYRLEQFKLKRTENIMASAFILPLSKTEYNYYNFKYENVFYLPPFHNNQAVNIETGMGKHILYHGNLSVNENEKAVEFIVNSIPIDFSMPIIIAGKNPPERMHKLVAAKPSIHLIANPNETDLQALIRDAHIHLLPTFQTTGIKLKLLNALFNGRHCLVKPEMLSGTGLDELCTMADTADEFSLRIKQLITQPFSLEAIQKRKTVLLNLYSNQKSVEQLIGLIWGKEV